MYWSMHYTVISSHCHKISPDPDTMSMSQCAAAGQKERVWRSPLLSAALAWTKATNYLRPLDPNNVLR